VRAIFKGAGGRDKDYESEMRRSRPSKFKITLATALVLVAVHLMTGQSAAKAAAINIVALGASNTWGWGVRVGYPERLEALLRAKGCDARVINAGISFDTTWGMLNRLDSAVPDGTQIVILQPGGNDMRFFGTKEQRAANIDTIVQKLSMRKIHVIVLEPVFPPDYYQWDGIHYKAKGHAEIAEDLLQKVANILNWDENYAYVTECPLPESVLP
jgi:acyl-CoA thioesterase-1